MPMPTEAFSLGHSQTSTSVNGNRNGSQGHNLLGSRWSQELWVPHLRDTTLRVFASLGLSAQVPSPSPPYHPFPGLVYSRSHCLVQAEVDCDRALFPPPVLLTQDLTLNRPIQPDLLISLMHIETLKTASLKNSFSTRELLHLGPYCLRLPQLQAGQLCLRSAYSIWFFALYGC